LRRAKVASVADLIAGREAADPEIPGVRWRFGLESGALVLWRKEGGAAQRLVVDFALGSGQHAVTFVSLLAQGGGPLEGLEHRLTYFTPRDALDLTPGHSSGQNQEGLTQSGFHLPPRVLRDCLRCHGTPTVPFGKEGIVPQTLIPNVSCERCHGPGRAHVDAAKRSKPEPKALAMLFGPDRWTAVEQLVLCGQCHRLPHMVPARTLVPSNLVLARFPSIGLSQSACYLRSSGELACTTCHDPHARVSTDALAYDMVCRSCHGAGGDVAIEVPARVKASLCPVQPRSGCVGCHMPRRDVGHGLSFSDHWLRRPDSPDDLKGRPEPSSVESPRVR
jgi:predicted CXXCH cytochrome family protein